jgi:hypothetical protein
MTRTWPRTLWAAIGEQAFQLPGGNLGKPRPGVAADDEEPVGTLQDPRVRASLRQAPENSEEPRLPWIPAPPLCDEAILCQGPHQSTKTAPHIVVRLRTDAHGSPHANLYPAVLSPDFPAPKARKAGDHSGNHVIHHLLERSVEIKTQAGTPGLQKEAHVVVHPA